MRRSRPILPALLGCAATLLAAPSAGAAVVTYGPSPGDPSGAPHVAITAAAGAVDHVALQLDGADPLHLRSAVVADDAGLQLGDGASAVCAAVDATTVRCGGDPLLLDVALGDGDDTATATGPPFANVTIDGGAGDDVITGAVTARGGDGADRLAGAHATLFGGPGDDDLSGTDAALYADAGHDRLVADASDLVSCNGTRPDVAPPSEERGTVIYAVGCPHLSAWTAVRGTRLTRGVDVRCPAAPGVTGCTAHASLEASNGAPLLRSGPPVRIAAGAVRGVRLRPAAGVRGSRTRHHVRLTVVRTVTVDGADAASHRSVTGDLVRGVFR